MRPLAVWLVARPQNAVLALAATLLLPVLQVLSGIVMVLLVLGQGVRLAVIEAVIAGALLAVIALFVGVPVTQVLGGMLTTWLPAVLLGATLQLTRSLTLTLQVSVLVATLIALGFHVVVDDIVAYWEPVTTYMLEWARESDLHEQAQLMESQPALTANMVTIAIVLSSWMLYVLYLLFGYHAYTEVSGKTGEYGRFYDLNFGRVLALIVALASLLAMASGAAVIQNLSFVLFSMFWLQGLAVVHWMYAQGHMPLLVVIVTYVLMPVLHVFVFLALAVVGFSALLFVVGFVLLVLGKDLSGGYVEMGPWRHTLLGWILAAREPLSVLTVFLGGLLIFWLAPNFKREHRISWPGALVFTVAWTVTTIGFNTYLREVAVYDRIYGPLATVVVVLVWVYLSAFWCLVSGEVNAAIHRTRRDGRGE